MKRSARRTVWLAAWVVTCLLLAGCGSQERKVIVKGRVSKGGQPLTVKDTVLGRVVVKFVPLNEPDPAKAIGPQTALVNQQDGTFEVKGNDGKGIPPGKYRIAVYQYEPMPTDKLQGKFGEKNSRIEREVTGGEEIDIDVGKPAG
jgi:hypothetical protein